MLPSYRSAITSISNMIVAKAVDFQSGAKPRSDFLSLMRQLGNPHDQCKFIHVAGTNGKGTTCLKLAKLLQTSGFKTGLYTSPHLFSFTERLVINGENISQEKFASLFTDVNYVTERNGLQLNFFEFLTAIGFMFFRNQRCEVVVLETGLGGRYDTTNVVNPLMSVITSIGLDHTDVLGKTLAEIAYQKAGIIKPWVPVVLGPQCEPVEVFELQAQKLNSPLYKVPTTNDLKFVSNCDRIVDTCVEVLLKQQKKMFQGKINDLSIKASRDITQRCRMQTIENIVYPQKFANSLVRRIIFDVGHNPSAIAYLVKSLRNAYPSQKFVFVYGASSRKNCLGVINELQPAAEKIYLIQADHFRAMPIQTLKDICSQDQSLKEVTKVIDNGKISSTISEVLKNQQVENVVVCGSFFIMEEAFGFFDKTYLQNSENCLTEVAQNKMN